MSILKELLALQEEQTVDIVDIVKTFPNKKEAEAHARKLWGTPRLTYMGNPILGGNNDVYSHFDEIIDSLKDDEDLYVELGHTMEDHEPIRVKMVDFQECYLGIDPKTSNLFVGLDAWMDEEDMNEKSDKEGIEYSEDKNSDWGKLWEEFKKASPYVILELGSSNGKSFKIHDIITGSGNGHGMFYSAGHKEMQRRGIIDLRLD